MGDNKGDKDFIGERQKETSASRPGEVRFGFDASTLLTGPSQAVEDLDDDGAGADSLSLQDAEPIVRHYLEGTGTTISKRAWGLIWSLEWPNQVRQLISVVLDASRRAKSGGSRVIRREHIGAAYGLKAADPLVALDSADLVMHLLDEQGPLTKSQLVRLTGLTGRTIQRIIRPRESKGLIQRTTGTDGAVSFRLVESGSPSVDPRVRTALRLVLEEGSIAPPRLARKIRQSPKTARRILGGLVKSSMLETVDSSATLEYTLARARMAEAIAIVDLDALSSTELVAVNRQYGSTSTSLRHQVVYILSKRHCQAVHRILTRIMKEDMVEPYISQVIMRAMVRFRRGDFALTVEMESNNVANEYLTRLQRTQQVFAPTKRIAAAALPVPGCSIHGDLLIHARDEGLAYLTTEERHRYRSAIQCIECLDLIAQETGVDRTVLASGGRWSDARHTALILQALERRHSRRAPHNWDFGWYSGWQEDLEQLVESQKQEGIVVGESPPWGEWPSLGLEELAHRAVMNSRHCRQVGRLDRAMGGLIFALSQTFDFPVRKVLFVEWVTIAVQDRRPRVIANTHTAVTTGLPPGPDKTLMLALLEGRQAADARRFEPGELLGLSSDIPELELARAKVLSSMHDGPRCLDVLRECLRILDHIPGESQEVRAATETIRGMMCFVREEFSQSVEHCKAASQLTQDLIARLNCKLNVVIAALAIPDLVTSEDQAMAVWHQAHRHQLWMHQVQAHRYLRMIAYQTGDDCEPDPAFIEAVRLVSVPGQIAQACQVEAAFAWRRELWILVRELAQEGLRHAPDSYFLRAFECLSLDDAQTGAVVATAAIQQASPSICIQILGLLGPLCEEHRAAWLEHARRHSLSIPNHDDRRDVLSIREALERLT